VVLWNADHQWVSFLKQFGRARIEDFRPVFIAELIPTQIAFATPLVFILGAMGLHVLTWRRIGASASCILVETMFWTIVVCFVWLPLPAAVGPIGFAPVFPVFGVAAGAAPHIAKWKRQQQELVAFWVKGAPPAGIVMFAALIVQANTGWLSGYRRDATVRSVGVGWRALASEIEAIRAKTGATCILAPDYGTTGWLAFYLPRGTCVVQRDQRIRWVNMGEPDPKLLAGKLLYVDELRADGHPFLNEIFSQVTRVTELQRKRGPLVVETYGIDLLEGAKSEVLD